MHSPNDAPVADVVGGCKAHICIKMEGGVKKIPMKIVGVKCRR